ncbi:AfsR/SARP family transcriptional regulator [Actinomadura rugatobispora]|uniref:BTAD domain-containing putative transcriptional regulator n=1 Tax=Actinomadura rugatobispora TaxID=1994 RepID=A0ABW1A2R5_9ACTN|nr:BTAD domain-containing putative transcriptional regulator [Actinomadura rugatobispora]
MIFRVMGPVELWIDGQRRDLGTAKERRVLVALLLTPRQPVPVQTLIRCVWDEDPPAKPRQSLYSYVTRLRNRLEGVEGIRLRSRQGSYMLDVEDEAVDLHRFRRLRDQARAIAGSGDDEYALERYREAAELWRAAPLADLSGDWVARTRRSLEEELLAATFERIDIELRRGHHADIVTELSDLVESHPFDERPVERLMMALFRGGRQAEALNVYRRTRDHLASELGTDAGPRLQELQRRILRNDAALARVPGQQPVLDRRPNNLPHDVHAFTGRDEELRQLLEAVPAGDDPWPSGAAVMIAIDGMPGVGKSALAVHLAHRLSGRFPDGRVYLDLHAHDPGQKPLDPAGALDILLRVIGVPAARIPRTLDERAALWRSQLTGSRMVIVLDDAAGHDQVRPLLPASAGCLVVITSRRRLTGLHDAHSLPLDVLPVEDAAKLFSRIAGAGRVADEPTEVAAVVRHCGRLPLAVGIAASRLRHRRAWAVADLLVRLGSDDRRLEELRNEGSEIALVFEVSYRGLGPPLREAFRRLGLHPGPELTAYVAAAALGRSVREAERVLEELLDRHLISEPARGRYRFHDLVHDYARSLARQNDSSDERRLTGHRIQDFYLAAADQADRILSPQRRRRRIRLLYAPPELPPLRASAQAEEWFSAELDSLLNASRDAPPDHVAQLAQVLATYLETQGHWELAADVHERAVSACDQLGDLMGKAGALNGLSRIRLRSTEYDGALGAAEDALGIYRSHGERHGEAEVLDHVSLIHWHQSRFAEALAPCEEALEIRRSLGDLRGVARSLDHAAIFLEYTGHYAKAERLREDALAIFAEIDDLPGRTMAFNNMGDLALRMGRVNAAARFYQDTAAAVAKLGRQYQAIWLSNMANVHLHAGDNEAALEGYRKALAVFVEIGDRRNEIEALLGIGRAFQGAGRYGEALIHHQKAHTIARFVNGRYEETMALRQMGEALTGAGRGPDAVDCFRRAYDLADRIGVPYETAKALEGMGTALLTLEGREAARRCWRQALAILESSGLPEEQAVKSYLRQTGGATGTGSDIHPSDPASGRGK